MKVIVQLRSSTAAHEAATRGVGGAAALTSGLEASALGISIDPSYPPVQLPSVQTSTGAGVRSLGQPLEFSLEPARSTYLVRGTIPDGVSQAAAMQSAAAHPDVVGIFSDPLIESSIVCPGAPAVGSVADVAKRLSVTKLKAKKMDGRNVFLAIVDTGINLAHLKSKGIVPTLDVGNSWTPTGVVTGPGTHPVNHGTMCAFDACIAAPKATLLDYAVLLSTTPGSTVMAGLLSDAVLAYAKLRAILGAVAQTNRAMVISNSWGMFSPTWDFPPGHPGNYSDNPNHPFNLIVASLEAAGADILFAAGNCGSDCPDGRCAFGATPPICGANSHPSVMSIAGVDTSKARVGYSSQGPGRLTKMKPDIAAYTHFTGSGVYPVDGGTSAACPVAAGVIAAVRTKYPAAKLSPLQMRSLVQKTAEDMAHIGFDPDYGWGILDPAALLPALP
ncbi:MAG: peptidase [Ramlibacter sp.]|nr:peptidase [Ramlibacter sp.]